MGITIISGGESGADRGVLLAAVNAGIETCGVANLAYKTEDKFPPKILQDIFRLTALSESQVQELNLQTDFKKCTAEYKISKYEAKDILNVKRADVVIAFLSSKVLSGRGTCKTANFAITNEIGNDTAPSKPKNADFLIAPGNSPVMYVWDITEFSPQRRSEVAIEIRKFLSPHFNPKVMVAGLMDSTINDAVQKGALPPQVATVTQAVQAVFEETFKLAK